MPTDSAYPGRYYQWMPYTVVQAIQMHRETHDPTMYNVPDAPLNILIEINMQGEKKTRFVTNFQKLAMIQHPFDHGEERQVLAFAKEDVSDIVLESRFSPKRKMPKILIVFSGSTKSGARGWCSFGGWRRFDKKSTEG